MTADASCAHDDGQTFVVTRSGRPIGELRPLRRDRLGILTAARCGCFRPRRVSAPRVRAGQRKPLDGLRSAGQTRPVIGDGDGATPELGLAETVRALRSELEDAVAQADGAGIQFVVGSVQMEFNVAVRREAAGSGKARFWVLEAGAEAHYARETIQKVSLTLQPMASGDQPVRIERSSAERP